MCGIVGVFNQLEASQSSIQVMLNNVQHRGPDSNGIWVDEDIGLGHVRLAVVDLTSTGDQPMQSKTKRFMMVFNGEIYNHIELREQLKTEFGLIQWDGNSDTETLLTCFENWGIKNTLQKLVGMFAIALWDKKKKKLTLARDRFGEKPLYWGWSNDALLFGSELKSLKKYPGFNAEVDRNSLALLLTYNYIPAPHSIYKGIEKLKAGHFVQIDKYTSKEGLKQKCFWDFNSAVESGIKKQFCGNRKETVDELEKRLTNTIRAQMISDVPLGAFLSGGVDSSIVVALMQKLTSKPVKTFAIGFDEPGYNEALYAKEVANYLGTEHTEFYVTADDVLSLVPKLSKIYCEPFADSSQLPTFLVSQMAKKHVTVALSGDGGDELFGGYNPYIFAPNIWDKIKIVPLPLRKLAVKIGSYLPLPTSARKLFSVLSAKDPYEFYGLMTQHWANATDIVVGSQNVEVFLTDRKKWPFTDCFEHWMMVMDAGQYMTDDILVKVDRAAMANSLEVRVPLLDHRIFGFAWQLPLEMKIRDGIGKWVLREVLYRYVPKEMIERPKKGFSIPLAQWLRGPLKSWAEELLSEKRLISDGYFNPEPIRNAWSEHITGKADNAMKLWSILMFQAWLEVQ